MSKSDVLVKVFFHVTDNMLSGEPSCMRMNIVRNEKVSVSY